MKRLSLATPVQELYLVGKTYSKRLKKLGIQTVEDLFYHYPFRYDDFSLISQISQIQPGELVTIQGEILASQNIYTRTGKKIQKATITDLTGKIEAVWFNQPFLIQTLKPGIKVSLSGKVDWFGRSLSLISPEYEIIKANNSTIHTARLVPVYPETYGLSSKWLRSRIAPLLKELGGKIPDWLPSAIKQKNQLIDLNSALQKIHFPQSIADINEARKRLKFDELLELQLLAQSQKKDWEKTKVYLVLKLDQPKITNFINRLPFTLTDCQQLAWQEICADLQKNMPMNRLLEGDVGSGKTVVATIAIYLNFLNGCQSVLMAPTEILSFQHFQTLKLLLEPWGIKTTLLTGSTKSQSSAFSLQSSDVLIGTHAIIYNQVKLQNLGLVVIDEQHRFGVEQRSKLINKGKSPHVLTMTATPIPRTIALTLYGDLELSVLDHLPPGRKTIKTWVVPLEKRSSAYQWISQQIQQHQAQVFIVCPLIEESETESLKDIRAAQTEFKHLAKEVFPQFKLGLMHGRLKTKEKNQIINDFRNQKLDILVATPVVEVGLDIPNATIMLIEAAQRFGLAQLHQLRGRIGRADKQSYCLLFASTKDQEKIRRLKAMQTYQSGFQLAELDLRMRGPGDLYGTLQHGFQRLKIASFSDASLIQLTNLEAKKISSQLDQFPLLKAHLKKYKIKSIKPN